jgi:hypothetical protein
MILMDLKIKNNFNLQSSQYLKVATHVIWGLQTGGGNCAVRSYQE